MCRKVGLEANMKRRHGALEGSFVENQVSIPSKSGDDMTTRHGWNMIANIKAKATRGARDKALIIGAKESMVGDGVSRHKVEKCFLMDHDERIVVRSL